MIEDLIPPFETSAFYLVGTFLLLVVLALWITWRVTDRKKKTPQPRVRVWQRKIDALRNKYRDGEGRVFALALAKLLRDFGSELSQINMQVLSVAEIRAATHYRGFSDLLTILEEPSFAPESEETIDELTNRAKAVVGAW